MALIACKECHSEISSDAKTCPKCGKKQSKPSWVFRGLVALAVIGMASAAIEKATMTPEEKAEKLQAENQRDTEKEESLIKLKICKAGQSAIQQILKAPASAKFPDCLGKDQFIVKQQDGTYTNTSYVDSQNSYGAMIRSEYIIAAAANGTQITVTDARLTSE